MLTKAQVKDIRSLAQHKYRLERGVYTVEGDKMAREWLLAGRPVEQILALEGWLDEQSALLRLHPGARVLPVTQEELEKVSSLQTPNKVLLVASLPQPAPLPVSEWCLALEGLQDPGNLGTIIRIADWFGIRHIIRSADSADFFSPKVVQSAMGGHLRVSLHTADLPDFLRQTRMPVMAATLQGVDVFSVTPPEAAVLLIGNESKGLSDPIRALSTMQVRIPGKGGAESLNAAVSAGIICALMLGR